MGEAGMEVGDTAVDTEAEATEVVATEVADTEAEVMGVADTEAEATEVAVDTQAEATEVAVDTQAEATEVVDMVGITEVVMEVDYIKDTDTGAAVMAVAMVVMVAEVTGDIYHNGGPRRIYFQLTLLGIL
jgi:hypothetical protein